MKKPLLIAIACFTMATGPVFAGVSQQSISFTGPADWVPGTQVTLDVSLTFAGYSALAFTYWLQVPAEIRPFLSVVSVMYFPPFSEGSPGPWTLDSDFGGIVPNLQNPAPPGTYHTTSITFALAPGAPLGTYTISTTTVSPHASQVSDTDFNDHNIPTAAFVFNVVPEPGTVALLGLGIVGGSLLINRRRCGRCPRP